MLLAYFLTNYLLIDFSTIEMVDEQDMSRKVTTGPCTHQLSLVYGQKALVSRAFSEIAL